jgi:hypothetical protein
VNNPEQKNYEAIERLETLLRELRADPSTAREPAAIREIGLEIAIAVREVGAMLINVGWEQTYSSKRPPRESEATNRASPGADSPA